MANVRDAIEALMKQSAVLTTRAVSLKAGVSRQAAHKQLRALVEGGELSVEGKARAARYHARKSQGVDPSKSLWAKVQQLGEALDGIDNPQRLTFHAQARLARSQTVDVASAGSLYRLSARLLLADVSDCDELTLDFTGVVDLGDEFIEEVFEGWAHAHPLTKLRIVNLDPKLMRRLRATSR